MELIALKQRKPIDFNQYNLKPPGAYRVDPNDFKDIMGTIEQADAYIKDGTKPESEKQLVPCVAITAENVDKLSAFVYTGE